LLKDTDIPTKNKKEDEDM